MFTPSPHQHRTTQPAMLLTMSTTTHPTTHPLVSLLSDWHITKRSTSLPKRLGMLCLEILALAAAMLVVPALMHQAVCALDVAYEQLGRRARSPWEKGKWPGIILSVAGLSMWHLWLGRLSWGVVLEEREEKKKTVKAETVEGEKETDEKIQYGDASREERKVQGISWGRILSRIVMPVLLLVLGAHFAYALVCRLRSPRPLVTRNEVDMMDVMGQLYGLGVG